MVRRKSRVSRRGRRTMNKRRTTDKRSMNRKNRTKRNKRSRRTRNKRSSISRRRINKKNRVLLGGATPVKLENMPRMNEINDYNVGAVLPSEFLLALPGITQRVLNKGGKPNWAGKTQKTFIFYLDEGNSDVLIDFAPQNQGEIISKNLTSERAPVRRPRGPTTLPVSELIGSVDPRMHNAGIGALGEEQSKPSGASGRE